MADSEKVNVDSIIARLLEGKSDVFFFNHSKNYISDRDYCHKHGNELTQGAEQP